MHKSVLIRLKINFCSVGGNMRIVDYLILITMTVTLCMCGKPKSSADIDSAAASNERIAQLKENIEDEPNNLEWRYQLALEYQQLGQNIEALKTYEAALAIDPGHSDIKYNYAELSFAMGEKRKALQSYKEILLGVDGQQYLGRISSKFVDVYKVTPVIASDVPAAFGMYSQDGTKIIYQAYQNENWDVFEYNRVAQNTTQLTYDAAHEENPVYSPDGQFICYTSTRDDHRNVDYNQKLRDIYLMDLQSKREVNLTTNSSNDWRPRFSRDGKFIVFVSERSDLREVSIIDLYSHIYIMEADGGFQLELTKVDANDGGPVMAGGENQPIYFDSNRNGNFAIFQMKSDGSEVKQITFNIEHNDVAPDVSLDKTKIVFFSDRDGNFEIYSMNSDGSNQQRLTANPADDINPTFSPDGTKILFHSNRGGSYAIYELDLEQKSDTASITQVISQIDAALARL
jgi:Tol biopolymer transport system component